MCIKKKREPLKPREGPYKTVNAYTIHVCWEQIFTVTMVLIQITLHSVFLVSPITAINHPILYFSMAIYYLLLLIQIVDYVIITRKDPVDRCLVQEQFANDQRKKRNTKPCELCRSHVTKKSYHCKRCNRCTEGFDHHCSFLGTCIGSRNYENFLRILMVFISWNISILLQTGWIFNLTLRNGEESIGMISQWVCIPLIVISSGLLIASTFLCGFHFYLCLCVDLTTIEFIQSEDTTIKHDLPNGTGNVFISHDQLQL